MKRFNLNTWVVAIVAVASIALAAGAREWTTTRRAEKKITIEQLRTKAKKMTDRKTGLPTYANPGMVNDLTGEARIPGKQASRETRTPDEPQGNFSIVVPQHSMSTSEADAYYAKLNPRTGTVTELFKCTALCSADRDFQTGMIRGDKLYINSFAMMGDAVYFWSEIDLNTGKENDLITFSTYDEGDVYSMTYDEINDRIYTLSYEEMTFTPNQLRVIDCKKPQWLPEYIDQPTQYGFIAGCVFNPADRMVYLFNEYNDVYVYNPNTGRITMAGTLDSEDILFQLHTPAIMCYSPKDEAFVVVFRDNDIEANVLYFINPEDWSVTRGAVIHTWHKPMITSIHCLDPYAPNNAPDTPAAIVTDFDKSSLTGSYTFTVPELLFSGVAMSASTQVHTVITLDGEVIYDQNEAPGTTKTMDLTIEGGVHEIAITCDLGENLASPTVRTKFVTGYDTPCAPTNVSLSGNQLTWTAPGAVGANGGYVNPNNFGYHIYVDGVRQDVRPVTDCKYTLVLPETQRRAEIGVTCYANSFESAPGSLAVVYGKAMTLPCEIAPTEAQNNLVIIQDGYNDNSTFQFWTDKSLDYTGYRMQVGYYNDGDEWLILPKMEFEDPSKLYNLTFDLGGIYTGTTREDLEIFLGKESIPAMMTEKIFDREYLPCPFTPYAMPVDFAVKEAGDYYIGFHYKSQKLRNGRGMTLRNFKVSQTEVSSGVPAAPTAVEFENDLFGENSVTVNITIPTVDAIGNPLDANAQVTVYGLINDMDERESGKPGETVQLQIPTAKFGWHQVNIWCSNAAGHGPISSFRRYVGIDTPLPITGLKSTVSDNNEALNMTWNPVAETGKNGGFVDPAKVQYRVYSISGVQTQKAGDVPELGRCAATFNMGPVKQYSWNLGIAASTEAGESNINEIATEILGVPNDVPQIETFGILSFDYNPVTLQVRGEFAGSRWEPNSNGVGLYGIDGNPIPSSGGILLGYNETYSPVRIGVNFPKFCTNKTNGHDVEFSVRVWDYKDAPRLYIMARCADDQELKQVAEVQLDRTSPGKWTEYGITLPEKYQNQKWVQVRLYGDLGIEESEFVLLDNYKAYVNIDHDLKVSGLTAPYQEAIGRTITSHVTVMNSGLETMRVSTLVTRVKDEIGKVLDRIDTPINALNPGRTFETYLDFPMKSEYAGNSKITIEAEIVNGTDEMPSNDKLSTEIILLDAMLPYVTDLTAARCDDASSAELTWSEPNVEYGSFLDFENHVPFIPTDQIGSWKNITLNPTRKSFTIDQLSWEGCDEPQAWAVVDAEKLHVMDDSRFCPHSGKQYLMARALEYEFGAEPAIKSSAWLISPEIVGGTKLSFWMTTANSANKETIAIYYSTTDDELDEQLTFTKFDANGNGLDTGSSCGSFIHLRNFTKSGSAAWELCEVELPEDAKYVALVYSSWDEIAAGIDDILVTPRNLDKWQISHYKVYRQTGDNIELVADNVAGTSYTDPGFADTNRKYFVVPMVKTERGLEPGPNSNVANAYSTGVENMDASQVVYGAKGEIVIAGFDGSNAAVYTTDGKYIRNAAVEGELFRLPADSGIYLVKIGNEIVKVFVK